MKDFHKKEAPLLGLQGSGGGLGFLAGGASSNDPQLPQGSGYPTWEVRSWGQSGQVDGVGSVTWVNGNDVYNVRDASNHIGGWTNTRSNNPGHNQSPTYDTSDGFRAWRVYSSTTPTKWIHFNGGSTWFVGGAADCTNMYWYKVGGSSNGGDWHMGGQDGTPTWTGGTNITNGTAGMVGVRGSQFERIGHGFDIRAGSTTSGNGLVTTGGSAIWHCTIWSFESNGRLTVFHDGVQVGQSGTSSGMNQANTNYFVGRSWTKEDLNGMDGYIAWGAYWKRTLSSTEAQNIWNDNKAFFGR